MGWVRVGVGVGRLRAESTRIGFDLLLCHARAPAIASRQ